MQQTPIAQDQTAWMADYIEGFEGRPPICPPEMSDLPGFISGHTEGTAARKRVSAARFLCDN